MSPASRGRKRKNTGGELAKKRGPAPSPDLFVESEPCDCPACSVEEFDPASLVDGLIETGAELSQSTDALDAEVTAASLVGLALAGDGFEEAIAAGLVPAIAERANLGALAMLLALGGVAGQGEDHDLDDAGLDAGGLVDPDDADGLGDLDDLDVYPAMAALLGARILALPAPAKPRAPHDRALAGGLAALAALELTVAEDDPTAPRRRRGRRGRVPKLPAKRAKSAQPAPIYQIKVGLRGAKPPIWRRLELPADVSLAKLHRAIQTAFGWDDGHLHVFVTVHGEFGAADSEFGVRAEDRVTLEQVAPKEKATLRYLYDFGDNWNHDILVERVLNRDDTARYPRCTGGRRAAPPEDCGGVWGYQCLLEILDDPFHPDHEELLGWLGLDDPDDLDRARFDADEITRALLRQP